MKTNSSYPDTGESGEAYDVERYSPLLESPLEATGRPESFLKPVVGRTKSLIRESSGPS